MGGKDKKMYLVEYENNEKYLKDFLNYTAKKFIKMLTIVSVILVVLGALNLTLDILDPENSTLAFSIGTLVFGLLIVPLYLILNKYTFKKSLESIKEISEGNLNSYIFNDDKVVSYARKNGIVVSEQSYEYKVFKKLIVTNEYYYLYLTALVCYILPRSDFKNEGDAGFAKFISSKNIALQIDMHKNKKQKCTCYQCKCEQVESISQNNDGQATNENEAEIKSNVDNEKTNTENKNKIEIENNKTTLNNIENQEKTVVENNGMTKKLPKKNATKKAKK